MPFFNEWDEASGEKIPNRDRTSSPPPPQTGTTVQADGTVIVANQATQPQIPPATPVNVTFPGPNEPMIRANGLISPRWWRFFDELYRRTGGTVDNINKAPVIYLPLGSPAALSLSGIVPTVLNPDNIRTPSTVSVTSTGYAPTITVA